MREKKKRDFWIKVREAIQRKINYIDITKFHNILAKTYYLINNGDNMKKENLEKVEGAFDTLLDFINESIERRKMAKEGLVEANEMSKYKGLIEKVYKEKEEFIKKQKDELKKVGKKIKKAYNKKKEFIKQQQKELKDMEIQIRKIFKEKKGFIKKQEEELEKIGKKLGIKQKEQNFKKTNIDVDIEDKINNNISLL